MQYLPRLVHLALQSCNLDDGTAFELADSDGDDNLGGAIGGLSSDEDEDTDNKRVRKFSVRTGVLDEKAAATQALGLFALHTKSAFMPYPSLTSKRKNTHYLILLAMSMSSLPFPFVRNANIGDFLFKLVQKSLFLHLHSAQLLVVVNLFFFIIQ